MAEFYRRSKGFPFIDYVTASHAAKLFEDARDDVHAELVGALEDADGFAYYAGWHESCGGLVWVRVRPVAREDIPVLALVQLESGQSPVADHGAQLGAP